MPAHNPYSDFPVQVREAALAAAATLRNSIQSAANNYPSVTARLGMTTLPMRGPEATIPWLGELGDLTKWNGMRTYDDNRGYFQTIRNHIFQKGFELTEFDIQDDHLGILLPQKTASLGQRFAEHPDRLFTGYLLNGQGDDPGVLDYDLTIDGTWIDGENFITPTGTPHTWGAGVTFFNKYTLALTGPNLEIIRNNMMRMPSDRSDTDIRSFVPRWLIVPPELEVTALTITQNTTGGVSPVDLSTQLANVINPYARFGLEVVVNPFLSDTNEWFLMAPGAMYRTVHVAYAGGPRIQQTTDFDTVSIKTNGIVRYGYAYGDPRAIASSEPS